MRSTQPTTVANNLAQFVLNNDLDGIDVDYEEFNLQLPQGQFILSHAPVGPWFQPTFSPGGCYITLDKNVGSMIDWYNIQYYNQSPSPGYEDCNTLLNSAGGPSIFEIKANGIDVNKLVIGKPGSTADIGNGGFIDPATLNTCIQQAVSNGWNAGVMAFQLSPCDVWSLKNRMLKIVAQFPHADTTWITTVKGNAFGA
ncbi:glycoside hydrolase family 18 protein [Trametes sanguinea]|nr:glycoside hydrolase family 18 protein [Trametes sanguinea]